MSEPLSLPTSPRLRFRLRTLFVLIVIVSIPCAWVGYSLNWIRQRRELLFEESVADNPSAPRAPACLWLFGEPGIEEIVVYRNDFERAKRLFPEASVLIMDDPIVP